LSFRKRTCLRHKINLKGTVTKLQSTLYGKSVNVKKDQRLPAVEHRVLRGTAGSKREEDRALGEICK